MKWMYRFFLLLTWPFISLFYPRKTAGRENIPAGAALLCGNHSSGFDPFLMAYSGGVGNQIRFMAKAELFRIPVVAPLLRSIGTFPVDRAGGAGAIKEAMRYLKAGEKVGIFPEGTRFSAEGESEAKIGAVRLAAKMAVPVVPVYIPRKKRLFRRLYIVFGEPYMIEADRKTATSADYEALAAEMMEKIRLLGESGDKTS